MLWLAVAWALPLALAACPSYRLPPIDIAEGQVCAHNLSLSISSSGTLRLPVLATAHNINVTVTGTGVTFSLVCDSLVNITGTLTVTVARGGYLQYLGLPALASIAGPLVVQVGNGGRIDTVEIADSAEAEGLRAGDISITGSVAGASLRAVNIGRLVKCANLYIDPFDSDFGVMAINYNGAEDTLLTAASLIIGTRVTNGKLDGVTIDWIQRATASVRIEANAGVYGPIDLNPSRLRAMTVVGQLAVRLTGPGRWSSVRVGPLAAARSLVLGVSTGGQAEDIAINAGNRNPLDLTGDLQLDMFSEARLLQLTAFGLRRANSITVVVRNSTLGTLQINTPSDCGLLSVNTVQVVTDASDVVAVYGVNLTHLVSAVPASTVRVCTRDTAGSTAGSRVAGLAAGLAVGVLLGIVLLVLLVLYRRRRQPLRRPGGGSSVRVTRQGRWFSSLRQSQAPPLPPPRRTDGQPVYAECMDPNALTSPPLDNEVVIYDLADNEYETPTGYLEILPTAGGRVTPPPDEPLYDLATMTSSEL